MKTISFEALLELLWSKKIFIILCMTCSLLLAGTYLSLKKPIFEVQITASQPTKMDETLLELKYGALGYKQGSLFNEFINTVYDKELKERYIHQMSQPDKMTHVTSFNLMPQYHWYTGQISGHLVVVRGPDVDDARRLARGFFPYALNNYVELLQTKCKLIKEELGDQLKLRSAMKENAAQPISAQNCFLCPLTNLIQRDAIAELQQRIILLNHCDSSTDNLSFFQLADTTTTVEPVEPRRRFILTFALVVGLLLGISWVLGQAFFSFFKP